LPCFKIRRNAKSGFKRINPLDNMFLIITGLIGLWLGTKWIINGALGIVENPRKLTPFRQMKLKRVMLF